jgi:DNA polymerase-1
MAIGKQARQLGYTHWFTPAPLDPNYPTGQDRKLITSDSQLLNLVMAADAYKPEVIAVDTETTGLNTEKEKLVGISIAISRTQAFYIPVGHNVGSNVSLDLALKVTAAFCLHAKKVCFYNYRFDIRVLKKAAIENYIPVDQIKYFDLSVLTFNADTNRAMPNLKWSALHFLGWKMKTYEEAVSKEPEVGDAIDAGDAPEAAEGKEEGVVEAKESVMDFSYNDPQDCYEYACDDALSTLNLIFALYPVYEEMKFICDVDNAVLVPLMAMEDDPVKIDRNLILQLEKSIDTKIGALSAKIYQGFGYSFNISSTKQLLVALERVGIQPKKLTKSKKGLSTDEEALEEIQDQHDVIPLVMEYKKAIKFKTTYVTPFLNEYREDLGGAVRFAYKHNAVPTGRFASGSDAKNKYFCKINGQAIPKPHPAYYKVSDRTMTDGDVGGIFDLLDYHFEQTEGRDGIEGFSLEDNVRAAYLPNYPYHLWVSIDYAAQELRIPANLANEPIWIDAFTHGKDVHKSTAMLCICDGKEENYDKEKRKSAKVLNFGALYQGTAKTFARQLGIPESEAQVLLDKWWGGLHGIRSWCSGMMSYGRQYGYVSTYFGRKRRLRHWFSMMSRKMQGYAERSCVNHPVQGTAADMMRIALINIQNKCKNWLNREDGFYMKSSIHDEINFSIDARDRSKFTDIVQTVREIMEIKIPEWQVPMIAEVSIGKTWGTMFPFTYSNGIWVPKA